MREANSPWKVSVAVDPKLIGAVNLRLVAKKLPVKRPLPVMNSAQPLFHKHCWRANLAQLTFPV